MATDFIGYVRPRRTFCCVLIEIGIVEWWAAVSNGIKTTNCGGHVWS